MEKVPNKEESLKIIADLVKKNKKRLTMDMLKRAKLPSRMIRSNFQNLAEANELASKKYPDSFKGVVFHMAPYSKEKTLEIIAGLVKKNKKPMTYDMLRNAGYSERMVRNVFDSLPQALEEARAKYPKSFEGVVLDKETKEQFILRVLNIFKSKNKLLSIRELQLEGITRSFYNAFGCTMEQIYAECEKLDPEFFKQLQSQNIGNKIEESFLLFCKKNKHYPNLTDLPFSKKEVTNIFGSFEDLTEHMREAHPKCLKDVIDFSLWSPKKLNKLKDELKNYKKFLITTIVGGCELHKEFLYSIQTWEKNEGGVALFLMADNDLTQIPDEIDDDKIVFDDLSLNNNIYISTIKILPKMINPGTGLQRLTFGEKSFIGASPKQYLEFIAQNKKNNLPRALMFTGAVTLPSYHGKLYYQKRTDKLAHMDHKIGAVIVEVKDKTHFHFRQVQAMKNGNFIDLGKEYSPNNVEPVRAEAFILGDLHAEQINSEILQTWHRVAAKIKPKRIILHDVFDGYSINHHDRNQAVTLAKKSMEKGLNLKKELDNLTLILKELTEKYEQVCIVHSNHDNFLEKYLQEGEFLKDPENILISLDLMKQLILGKNPIEWYVRSNLSCKNLIWWNEASHVEIEGCLVTSHGHRGPNGSRGSLKALEKIFPNIMLGHSHTPGIIRDGYQLGYSGGDHTYAVGPSSWMETSGVIYRGGGKQLINSIDGECFLQ